MNDFILAVTLVIPLLPLYLTTTVSSDGVRPKIYVYELPEKYHDHVKFGNEVRAPTCFYALDEIFPRLLRESPYMTKNAEEADYFYVDAWMYWGWLDIKEIIAELKRIGPYWERKEGADHIWTVTADPGRCQYPQAEVRKSIFLHHMGMLRKLSSEPCNLFEQWGGSCDPSMVAGLGALRGDLPWGCHIPYQDIVVPPSMYEYDNISATSFLTPYLHDELKGLNRSNKLYYAGKIDLHETDPKAKEEPWSDASYSFGARQTVFRMFQNAEGFVIHTTHAHGSYWKDLSSSIFCLAAAGWGWGGRMKAAVTRGCIPLILQDGIKVEFEEQMPMKDYALRIPTWMAHKLPDIMDSYIKSGKVDKMQKALSCAWRLHWWRRPHGRAFELVMCELKRRVLGVAAHEARIDWDKCALNCGGKDLVRITDSYNNV